VDLLRGLRTDVLNGDKKHPVFEDEIDDDVRPWFHRCPFILLKRCEPTRPVAS
jgi:hypothetical protein